LYTETSKADNCVLELDSNGVSVQLGLVDFGVAKLYRGEYGANMANFCSGLLGGASYVAPEICSFERYGAPADLFALGVIVNLLLMKAYPSESGSLGYTGISKGWKNKIRPAQIPTYLRAPKVLYFFVEQELKNGFPQQRHCNIGGSDWSEM
jgi:serine/threonine protein kinase